MIWLIFACLAVLAAGTVILSLSKTKALDSKAAETAIFEDQLREIDTDAARGLIGAQEADGARVEVKRRLLATLKRGDVSRRAGDEGRFVVVIVALLVPLMGAGIYSQLGEPATPSIPFAMQEELQAEINEERSEVADLAEQLRTRLLAEPDGGPSEGWVMLARTYMGMERFEDAAEAFRVVAERPDAPSAAWSLYAEALVFAGNGTITPAAKAAIDRAYELDNINPAATYYKALALDQADDSAGAHDLLLARIAQTPEYQPWMDVFVETANQLALQLGRDPIALPDADTVPGPTPEQVEAAGEMSAEDRQAFIESMVEGLATRLEDDPSDIDGWLRLATAYTVLGKTDLARKAYTSARTALGESSDDPRLQTIEQGLSGLNE